MTSVIEYIEGLGKRSGVALKSSELSLTFQEMFAEAYSLAEKFINYGVQPGALVAVVMASSPEFVVTQLACTAVGAVFFPIDPALPSGELEVWLKRARPHYLYIAGSLRLPLSGVFSSQSGRLLTQLAQSSIERQIFVAEALCEALLVRPDWETESMPTEMLSGGFLRFSSGTTGLAKGVCISQERAIERAQVMRGLRYPGVPVAGVISEDDVVLCALPLPYHFVVSVLWFLQQGATIQFPDINESATSSASIVYASPVQVRRLLANERLARALSLVFCTSMPLPGGLGEKFCETYGVPVVQLLGNIEVGIVMANCESSVTAPHLLGRELPAYEVEVRNESGLVLPIGEVGELFVRGPGAANCYLDPLTPVAKEGADQWISTGDMVRRNQEGDYDHCGRTVSAINVAGHKVFAEEVERELCAEPGIIAARVFGEPHDIYGTRLVAEVVLNEGHSFNERAVRSRLRSALASYKIPTEYICREELPCTPTGKVRRPSLGGVTVR